ncbi:MAG: hypothetical protein IPP47_05430 [Bryobacterales bacterium]|nr:hypothetical protein [Bryobacterales bacterium]
MSCIVLTALLLWAQDPTAIQAPPTRIDIEAERMAAEAKIEGLTAQLDGQRLELERQKGALAALEARFKDGRGYVTKDEFSEYQKALSAFQKALTDQMRQQEAIEREMLNSRLKTEQAVFENGEAALASLITNLSGMLNTVNTARALLELPSPVAASAKYQAAVQSLEAQAKKSRIPSIAGQLMGSFPQVAWLNTAVTLVLAPAFKSKSRDADLKTLVCARDFAEGVDTARRARLSELETLAERMTKLRERMVRTHERMLTLVRSAGPVKEQMAVYFRAMRGREGERPMQALGALDDRLRAARREVASARGLLTDYRQLTDTAGEHQARLREFILSHQKYACSAAETYQQDVSKSVASLDKAQQQFAQMQQDTANQEPLKVLDALL